MGAFATLSMMGLFPNAGQDVYLIIAPFFKQVRVRNPWTNKIATIRTTNFDGQYKNIYVQSAILNGKPYTKNWLTHSFFTEGGTLELVLGATESEWGTKKEDLPPSSSTDPKWKF
jgi:putative alpha-1,2-mannosidase